MEQGIVRALPEQGSFWLPDSFFQELILRERGWRRSHGLPVDEFGMGEVLNPQIGKNILIARNDAEIKEASYKAGGRAAKPKVMAVVGPQGHLTLIPGLGVVEAAEMGDLMSATLERQMDNIKRHGQAVPFAEIWEERGLPSQEQFPDALRQAARDRIARHKANPRTDPAPTYHTPIPQWVIGDVPVDTKKKPGFGKRSPWEYWERQSRAELATTTVTAGV